LFPADTGGGAAGDLGVVLDDAVTFVNVFGQVRTSSVITRN
jgi:hypothetical protein